MREINFFSPYIAKKKTVKVGQLQVILAIVFLFLLCGSVYTWNMINIIRYNLEIAKSQAFLTNPDNLAAVKKYADTKQKVDIIKQYEQGVAVIEQEMKGRGIIGSALIAKLNSSAPHDVYLKGMSITRESVAINGTGSSRKVIGQYEHNLQNLGLFDNVFVTIVTNKEGDTGFTFSVNCKFRGGVADEIKQ